MIKIRDKLQIIGTEIESATEQYHREKNSVQLLAVSKRHPIEAIQEAYYSNQECPCYHVFLLTKSVSSRPKREQVQVFLPIGNELKPLRDQIWNHSPLFQLQLRAEFSSAQDQARNKGDPLVANG